MRCGRPGCDGRLEDVGGTTPYCDVCGLAPGPGGDPGEMDEGEPTVRGDSASSGGSWPSRSSSSRRSVPGRLSRSLGAGGERSVSVRGSGSHSRGGSSGRGELGAGLVTVPPVPRSDPRAAVLADPQVAERKRWCGNSACGAPVGRSRGERPGRTEGYCTRCGHPYSFTPKLRPGDVVRGQYEVAGCIAHGGLGWIYLALDHAVGDRWVVLKGLLDTGDKDALAAAVSERRFLAEIEHATIVRIYNFVEHLDPRTGSLDGYIVMEYVGGRSLKEIAAASRDDSGHREPLPVEQAVAYGIEALDAIGHLHERGLLYCDFKVDNAIQQGSTLKLIDLGAVRRMDDAVSPVYGTIGYQAPEVASAGPSVASDLYTVARTLAVLTFDFQGYSSVFADSLPPPDEIEVFSRYESFYRLLVRATDPDPRRRFGSAREMAEQLTGVLREVVALNTGQPRPALSVLFGPELRVPDTELVRPLRGNHSALGARRPRRRRLGGRTAVPAQRTSDGDEASAPAPPGAAPLFGAPPGAVPPGTVAELDPRACALALPRPYPDPEDPETGLLAGLSGAGPAETLTALAASPGTSPEKRLRQLRALLELDDHAGTAATLAALEAERPDDWRVVWYRGLVSLATRDHASAAIAFDAVYDAFPGETAPKLALAVCAEALGQADNAAEYYDLVWTTDRGYVSAAFGLARVRLAAGDRRGAVAALESVPESSVHHAAACAASVRARLRARSPREPLLPDLLSAAERIEQLGRLGIDAVRRETLRAELLGSALDWVLAGRDGAPPGTVPRTALLGDAVEERDLRFGLERSYRTLARLAQRGEDRINLVEAANRFRPRTWV
ncbi:serine/threonine-protein kinase [Streptomyces sp. ICBB 8177]|uniref:serine/threonine-protein kinase n=1 Tax=Streptomyces sp. ICBB 8177 TaxID=563922 RepID=UPI0018EE97DB|nr:serine/threonine-protein kinase [Streptomyces sp. ICBB 8177]